MSYDEIRQEIEILRDNPNATATFKGLLDREELGIKRAQELWEGFNTRRMSLR